MDIVAIITELPGVALLAGLPDAWHWSAAAGRFHYAIALSADGQHAFQVNTRDGWDPELVSTVLSVARERSDAVRAANPFALLEGFRAEGTEFDVVAGVIPAVHRYHGGSLAEFNEVVHAVFPAYRCEFSGLETQKEATLRFNRMLDPANLRRAPRPFIRMRYDNPRTGGGSVGTARGITTVEVLTRELGNLVDSGSAFVEFENFRGQVRMVRWQDGMILEDDARRREVRLDELLDWVQSFVRYGEAG